MALLEEPIKVVETIKNFVNGELVKSSGEIVDVANPATGQVMKLDLNTCVIGDGSGNSSLACARVPASRIQLGD